jgi:glucose/arabinose dehydrogenase
MRRFFVSALLLLAPPAAPTITEPSTDGKIVNPADVHMEAGGYSDADGNAHASTDWEIWRGLALLERVWSAPAATGLSKVHIHLADGAFEGSLAGQTQLAYDADYVLRVRFRDSAGEVSAWSARAFRTSPAGPPGIPSSVPWAPSQAGYQVEVVATGFQLPVNIAFVPSPGANSTDPFFYVTELYGKIKVVRRDGTVGIYVQNLLNFSPTGAFPGSGEQGLAGIAVDPLTGDVIADMLYEDLGTGNHYPKVVRFTSSDGGQTAATQTILLDMAGETQGQSHQVSNLTFGPDGKLYVHVGDGFATATAQDLASFRGKILRMDADGSAPPDNPFYLAADGITATDYVYAYGLRNPFGGGWRAADGFHYEVENGPSVDRFAKVVAGTNYLWDGTEASMGSGALYNWNPAHAPVNVVFVQSTVFAGSGYPGGMMDHAFVSESGPTYATGPQADGKRLVEFVLDGAGNRLSGPSSFVVYTGTGKATAVGLAAGPDGLYFTDLYKDAGGAATDAGANVLRVRYTGTPPPPPPPPPAATGGSGHHGSCGSCGLTGFVPALVLILLAVSRNQRHRFSEFARRSPPRTWVRASTPTARRDTDRGSDGPPPACPARGGPPRARRAMSGGASGGPPRPSRPAP